MALELTGISIASTAVKSSYSFPAELKCVNDETLVLIFNLRGKFRG